MKVQMVDLASRHAEVASTLEPQIMEVLRSGRYVGGPWVEEAERLAARGLGRRGAVGVASGTDALMIGLQALGVGPGDEVIVPALSFFATAGAVATLGAQPVVVDVLDDATMDPEAARAALTRRTTAVIPVHLFGNLARKPELGLPVLDDAAQAVGAPRSNGQLTAVSTYPTKTWGGAGEGGFVVGDDPELLERVRRLANHGASGPDHFFRIAGAVGRNSRLDAIQGVILAAHAAVLARRVRRRQAIASRYDASLPPDIHPLPRSPDSPVQQYCVLCPHRDALRRRLADRGVATAVYYPIPLHKQPAIAQDVRAPVAEDLAERLLALPVHAHLSDDQVGHVIEALRDGASP